MRGSSTADYPHAWQCLQRRGGGGPEDSGGFALGGEGPDVTSPRVKEAV